MKRMLPVTSLRIGQLRDLVREREMEGGWSNIIYIAWLQGNLLNWYAYTGEKEKLKKKKKS